MEALHRHPIDVGSRDEPTEHVGRCATESSAPSAEKYRRLYQSRRCPGEKSGPLYRPRAGRAGKCRPLYRPRAGSVTKCRPLYQTRAGCDTKCRPLYQAGRREAAPSHLTRYSRRHFSAWRGTPDGISRHGAAHRARFPNRPPHARYRGRHFSTRIPKRRYSRRLFSARDRAWHASRSKGTGPWLPWFLCCYLQTSVTTRARRTWSGRRHLLLPRKGDNNRGRLNRVVYSALLRTLLRAFLLNVPLGPKRQRPSEPPRARWRTRPHREAPG